MTALVDYATPYGDCVGFYAPDPACTTAADEYAEPGSLSDQAQIFRLVQIRAILGRIRTSSCVAACLAIDQALRLPYGYSPDCTRAQMISALEDVSQAVDEALMDAGHCLFRGTLFRLARELAETMPPRELN